MAKKKEAVKKTIPGAVFVEDKKDKSNQKKKEAEAAAATSSLTKQMSEIKISSKITPEQIEADLKLKSIRKLKKQLREIEQLEEKIANGSLVTPEKEQLDKISKKQTVIEQLDELEE
jgi:partner of Y14 and mago protein